MLLNIRKLESRSQKICLITEPTEHDITEELVLSVQEQEDLFLALLLREYIMEYYSEAYVRNGQKLCFDFFNSFDLNFYIDNTKGYYTLLKIRKVTGRSPCC